jgi:hypothetical protein
MPFVSAFDTFRERSTAFDIAGAVIFLNDCHTQAELSAPDRGVVTAGSCTDNNKIETSLCHSFFLSGFLSGFFLGRSQSDRSAE